MSQVARSVTYDFRKGIPTPPRHFARYRLADLDAGADLAAAIIFSPDEDVQIRAITITPDGDDAGVDASNTSVFTATDGSNTLVTKTYDNDTNDFPDDSVQDSLGTIAAAHAMLKDGESVELAVTNGATANLPAVEVTIEYTVTREVYEQLAAPFRVSRTAAAGHPTVTLSGGALVLTLDATEEAQLIGIDFGDHLAFDIDDVKRIEILAAASASLDAAVSAVLGAGSAVAADPDDVAASAWFKLPGDNTMVVETDDGTTNQDDKDTGLDLAATFRRLVIDFASGVHGRTPPETSLGGKGAVQFSAENSAGLLAPVAKTTLFNMSQYSSGLQPILWLLKSSDVATATLSIKAITFEFRE